MRACVCDPEDEHSPADPATSDTGVTMAVLFVCQPALARGYMNKLFNALQMHDDTKS